MNAAPTPDHDELAGMLPDHAVGALSTEAAEIVERHLAGCAACRAELANIQELIGLLVVAAPPSPGVKASLLARVATAPRTATPAPVTQRPPRLAQAKPRRSWREWWPVAPVRLGFAVALLLIVGLGAWNLFLQQELDESPGTAQLLGETAAVVPLTDSQISPPASGLLITDPMSEEAVLVAQELPELPPDQRFQVWLFTEDGSQVSGGLVAANSEGVIDSRIRAPDEFGAYVAVALSAEPAAGSPNPTSPLVLGGWLPSQQRS